MNRPIILTAIALLAAVSVTAPDSHAQSTDAQPEPIYVPFNVSFVPGLSIADAVSDATGRPAINRFSLNILAGRAYGLDGTEFGTIWNANTEFVDGVQFAGIANTVGGDVNGVQFGGIANTAGGDVNGVQFGGIVNTSGGTLNGFQSSGLLNLVRGDVQGLQSAGLANVAGGSVDAQMSGLTSVARGPVRGIQLSGLASVAGAYVDGAQVSGLISIASDSLNGAQIAGLLNVAQDVDGLQLGLINISRRHSGAPIGLFSYVYETGLRFDVMADESGIVSAAIRSGNARISNYIGAGVVTTSSVFRYASLAGIGVERDLSSQVFGSIEGLFYGLHGDQLSDWASLTKLRLLGGWRFSEHVAVIGGPALNFYFSPDSDGGDLAPFTLHSSRSGDTHFRVWTGLSLGLRFAPKGF